MAECRKVEGEMASQGERRRNGKSGMDAGREVDRKEGKQRYKKDRKIK